MLQFDLEVICNFITFSTYATFTILCVVQGYRHTSTPLYIFATFLFGFTLGTCFQAFSYMLVTEDQVLALDLKLASGLLVGVGIVVWFIWVDYVQFERVRPLSVIPIVVFAALLTNALLTTEGLYIYTFVEDGVPLGVSIGKEGLAHVWDLVSQALFVFSMAWYFTRLWRNAPPILKPTARFLAIFIFIQLIAGLSMNFILQSLPDNGIALILTSLSNLDYALIVCVYILVIIRVPQLLYTLGFQVSRLMVIEGASGVALFDYKFSEHNIDVDLFSGLLQGFQQMTAEVLQRGALREIRLASGTLILAKYPRFSVGLLTSRSSRFLTQCIEKFARAFDARYHALLTDFSGDVTKFADAVTLVNQIFEYIPRYVQPARGSLK